MQMRIARNSFELLEFVPGQISCASHVDTHKRTAAPRGKTQIGHSGIDRGIGG